jgi:hypothetical protein
MGKIMEEDNDEYVNCCKDLSNYIVNHIKNVNLAFDTIVKPVFETNPIPGYTEEDTKRILYILSKIVPFHDKSKWTDEEFPYYRQHFNPTTKEKNASAELIKEYDKEFDIAWRHHYTHNDHHPEFWCNCQVTETYDFGTVKKYIILDKPVDPSEAVDMPIVSILHMICDWASFCVGKDTTPWDWYLNKADIEKKCLTNNTKTKVEELMTIIFPNGKKEGE